MIEGLWIVQYEGVHGGDGGVVVFVNGQALGGDNAFVYTGTYRSDDRGIAARVQVRNFAPGIQNVLGIEGNFELALEGKLEGGVIKGTGSLINQAGPGLAFKLTRVTELTKP